MPEIIHLTSKKGRFEATDKESEALCFERLGENSGIPFCKILKEMTSNKTQFVIDGKPVEQN